MTPPAAWAHLPFFTRDLPRIEAAFAAETRDILPPEPQRFAALAAVVPEDVRVVILGQDPYPTPGHAHGFAFSVEPEVRPLPRSLSNIHEELKSDLGACPADGDLRFWADQGVLLLNTALTVPAGDAGGHARLGWSRLTEEVVAELSERPRAFLLWGNHAQKFERFISGADHLILKSPHPSPLSARRGFFGSRPFSQINDWLIAKGERPIDWTGT
ncbi:uracil-DNA glycosylase [Allosediminivita pacifica]|uniref:Uracil-DNA glycosylase n=1 Tax=Allosediminivita pacifica TaxID=1267769 RepID=A0A2T6B2G4_9RHOB|nr:uracil-DNA glycosylase [Allosediminivita pacifica]PTX50277.1 uracil-DNA glycosylase [Allosediminivita pacifica]GGB02841.1 uracil-DNA glycosylase [Allosediminivita pacifica]